MRDLMGGCFDGKDFDVALQGDPLTCAQVLAQQVQGSVVRLHEGFGQYRVVKIEEGKPLTIDLARIKGNTIEEDLSRRDFTINAMAIDLGVLFKTGSLDLIDPLGGLKDLREKRVKHSAPSALRDDPVRIMRGIRIARKYGFTINLSLKKAMREDRELLTETAPERIRAELFKIMDVRGIYHSLALLQEVGILEILIPEVSAFHECKQGDHHRYDLWEHSLRTAREIESVLEGIKRLWPASSPFLNNYFQGWVEGDVRQSTLLKFTAFLHDIGKPMTKRMEEGRIRFFGHELEGGMINRKVARRFKLGKKAQRYMETVTKNHMRILNLALAPRITQRAKYRFFRDLGNTGLDILLLSLADASATGKDREGTEECGRISSTVDSFMDYYFTEFGRKKVKPLLSGKDIMHLFGMTEGTRVGELLTMVKEAEAQGKIATRQEAIAFLKGRVS